MRLKYLSTILEQQDGFARIPSLDWSPNGMRLAIATSERSVLLFNSKDERWDKFSTKPNDPKTGKKNYSIKSIAFSPDSSKLAVGQTDNIAFVYRLGETWNEKKVICNKFVQRSSVTALTWPGEERLIIGLADGKVRMASCRNNKCSTLYRTDVFIVSLSVEPNLGSFISGHADGSVILYSFKKKSQAKIFIHTCPPFALAYTNSGIISAGCDRRIVSYKESGEMLQQFDFSKDLSEKEFMVAAKNSTGQNICIGSYNRIRLFTWNHRRGALEEGKPLEIANLYTITALTWNPNGSTVAFGTVCGGVIMIDCCLKRMYLKGRFDTTYISASHVFIKDNDNDLHVDIKARNGNPIEDIKIMGRNRFVVGYTSSSLIIADMNTERTSEIDWEGAGNEKFVFDNDNVCLIVNAGEVTVIEYGNDKILGWIRTEFISSYLLSVRVSSRKLKDNGKIKRISYLIDVNTLCVDNLVSNNRIAQIYHPVAIDWLELSESASKLLFRDKGSHLTLIDLDSDSKSTLLQYCTYVQWVPNSDVIVAQFSEQLHVWYHADSPDQVTTVQIKGDIETVMRDENVTEVIVQEANAKVAYELDQTLIEFSTALDNLEFGRAVHFLERRNDKNDDVLWRQLAKTALDQQQLLVAQRCFAAFGDISRVLMLVDIIRIADESETTSGSKEAQDYRVRAGLALMRKDLKTAERIYLEQNRVDEAIEMLTKFQKWEQALNLAQARSFSKVDELKLQYRKHLLNTGQDDRMAEIAEREGNPLEAINLYLKGNLGDQAARVILSNRNLLSDEDLVHQVAITLIRTEFFEQAGDLFEAVNDFERSLECYRKGKIYFKAIKLVRMNFPERVVKLEEECGEFLISEGNHDAAISHLLESGKSAKALDAAIRAKQWGKAAEIADALDDNNLSKEYYGKIADHHASSGDFDRAEMLYIEANLHREAIAMYNKASRWSDSYRLAKEFLSKEESNEMYENIAQQMEKYGRLKDVEQLYISIEQPNKAIAMYKAADRIDEMMNLVEIYNSEGLNDTYKRLATELEEKEDLKAAEEKYLLAGDWKSAMNMYRAAEQWSDAYRIAKQEGGAIAQKQIAYLWAKSIGGDAAVKLLQKFNLLEESIELACENSAFDFAFQLSRLGANSHLPFVHLRFAQQLEEKGELEEAAKHYIEANKPREAVLMYVHCQEWDNAENFAKEHCEEALTDVYKGQARLAIENKDFPRAESYLLRANHPDIILHHYREIGMWPDALRIARDYVPSSLAQLQAEFDKVQLKSSNTDVHSLMAQAKEFEMQGEYQCAVQCYLKVKEPESTDVDLITRALLKAADLAMKFLSGDNTDIINEISERLLSYKRFNQTAEIFMTMGEMENAVKAFVLGEQWSKAKKIAEELVPDMAIFVNERYKESLKKQNRLDELIEVDAVSAIEALIERGQWTQALSVAKKHKSSSLEKFVPIYAGNLINEKRYVEAIKVIESYEISVNPNAFDMYQQLIERIINNREFDTSSSYRTWSSLRNILLKLSINLHMNTNLTNDTEKIKFERFFEVAHYVAVRCALMQYKQDEVKRIIEKINISLLRYADIVRVDKLFYDSGMMCRNTGRDRLAFIFLNYYLDLCDAIEEQNFDLIDPSIFDGTEIPREVLIMESTLLTHDEHEDVKEWILAKSVEQNIERTLPRDDDGNFESNLISSSGISYSPCIITGYPVRENGKQLGASRQTVDVDVWRIVTTIQNTKSNENINDLMQFIADWTYNEIS